MSIEVESWRSEGTSAKGFIGVHALVTMFELLAGNFTRALGACIIKAEPPCFRSGRIHVDRRHNVNNPFALLLRPNPRFGQPPRLHGNSFDHFFFSVATNRITARDLASLHYFTRQSSLDNKRCFARVLRIDECLTVFTNSLRTVAGRPGPVSHRQASGSSVSWWFDSPKTAV